MKINKQYQILSFIDCSGRIYRWCGNGLYEASDDNLVYSKDELYDNDTHPFNKIYSVKSKNNKHNNGEVFIVGNEVRIINSYQRFIIGQFKVSGGEIYVFPKEDNMFECHNFPHVGYTLDLIESPNYLYSQTIDGYSISDYDNIWIVNSDELWSVYETEINNSFRIDKDLYYFKDEDEAYEFYEQHRPQYSKKDIREMVRQFLI